MASDPTDKDMANRIPCPLDHSQTQLHIHTNYKLSQLKANSMRQLAPGGGQQKTTQQTWIGFFLPSWVGMTVWCRMRLWHTRYVEAHVHNQHPIMWCDSRFLNTREWAVCLRKGQKTQKIYSCNHGSEHLGCSVDMPTADPGSTD